jgi:hypothetical protein
MRVQVPPGHLWLEGDNGPQSLDSRTYGCVPEAMVTGRVLYRVRAYPRCGVVAVPMCAVLVCAVHVCAVRVCVVHVCTTRAALLWWMVLSRPTP